MPSGLSIPGQAIWHALQTYGAFSVDTSGGGATGILYTDPNSVRSSDVWVAINDLNVIEQYVRVVDP